MEIQKNIIPIEIFKDLDHTHKIKRREALDNILSFINKDEESTNYKKIIFPEEYEASLISRLSDDSEINRSKTCQVVREIFKRNLCSKKMIGFLMPVISHRIGKIPFIEECEENRLELLKILESIIDTFDTDVQNYTNEFCFICAACLNDNFSEVILKSCDCIIKYATLIGPKFQMFSNSFPRHLVKCISKHKLKVRIKAINTLGKYCSIHYSVYCIFFYLNN